MEMNKFITKIFLILIRGYQRIVSPHFLPRCKYYPTCSAYAYEAVRVHGFFTGGILATLRLLRCNPFAKGGIDFVPEKGFIKHLW